MRKLVKIKVIDNLIPIAKKDRIELALIGGWEVIVKKGEFIVGDTCVFFELDSFLPDIPLYNFLPEKRTYKGTEGYRLKTMKLQGIISQGLVLPKSSFGDFNLEAEDLDLELGVVKYDVADVVSMNQNSLVSGLSDGGFPDFIPKTEQERIQNVTHYSTTKINIVFEETLKLDGSSCTMYKIPNKQTLWGKIKKVLFGINQKDYFGVCSRNQKRALKGTKVSDFWKAAIKYKIESKLPTNFAVQGELLAPNIQSNHENVDDVEFYVFDIYDIVNKQYLTPYARAEFMKEFLVGVKHVPILGYVEIFKECSGIKEILSRVEGVSMNPNTISEGRVYKALDGSCTFKVISNKYLLKCEV